MASKLSESAKARQEREQQEKDAVISLQRAYLAVFDPESPMAKIVLKDLSRFCRANQSTFDQDARVHAALEGRRETWLHIDQYINLETQELLDKLRIK